MAGEQKELTTLHVEDVHEGMRLDVFVASGLATFSRSKIQKLIKQGDVSLNEKRITLGSTKINSGDIVRVHGTIVEREETLDPVAMPLDILFEDEYLIVINKPAGIAIHPGAGTKGPTLVQGLLHHCRTLSSGGGEGTEQIRPGIVHRLDKDTTGALVCAKTDDVHAHLAKQFQDKTKLLREYAALLDGVMSASEMIRESYIVRDPDHRQKFASFDKTKLPPELADLAKYAKSVFKVMAVYGNRLTIARIRLFTGRTHQIRVHAGDLGVPIIGDQLYHHPTQLPHQFPENVRNAVFSLSRQMLHARVLGFDHPVTKERMEVKAPFPDDFSSIISMLEPMRAGLS